MSESSSSAELSVDDEIQPSGSNKMRFATIWWKKMKKNVLGCIAVLIRNVSCAKFVRYFMESQVQNLMEVGEYDRIMSLSLKIMY